MCNCIKSGYTYVTKTVPTEQRGSDRHLTHVTRLKDVPLSPLPTHSPNVCTQGPRVRSHGPAVQSTQKPAFLRRDRVTAMREGRGRKEGGSESWQGERAGVMLTPGGGRETARRRHAGGNGTDHQTGASAHIE